jgi:hypothetical protein
MHSAVVLSFCNMFCYILYLFIEDEFGLEILCVHVPVQLIYR